MEVYYFVGKIFIFELSSFLQKHLVTQSGITLRSLAASSTPHALDALGLLLGESICRLSSAPVQNSWDFGPPKMDRPIAKTTTTLVVPFGILILTHNQIV